MNDNSSSDPFNLSRFVSVQEEAFARALAEIKNGRKTSHWMWYIFPQFTGSGSSSMSVHYAIKSLDEARAYLAHPVLGPRLVECAEAAIGVKAKTAEEIFGSVDAMKLRSCADLFASVSPAGSVFHRLVDTFGQPAGRS